MRNITIALMILSSILYSNYNDFDFKYSTSDLNKYKLYNEIEKDLKISKFQKIKMFEKYGNNENFKKGLYEMTKKDIRISKGLGITVPNYTDGIDLILKDSNILSSYTAFKLLEMNFLIKGNTYAKKVLRKATRELYIYKFPMGMLWYAKSYKKDWSNKSTNYKKSIKILEETKNIIKNIEKKKRTYSEEITLHEVLVQISKIKALISLKKRVESGKTIKITRHIKGISK